MKYGHKLCYCYAWMILLCSLFGSVLYACKILPGYFAIIQLIIMISGVVLDVLFGEFEMHRKALTERLKEQYRSLWNEKRYRVFSVVMRILFVASIFITAVYVFSIRGLDESLIGNNQDIVFLILNVLCVYCAHIVCVTAASIECRNKYPLETDLDVLYVTVQDFARLPFLYKGLKILQIPASILAITMTAAMIGMNLIYPLLIDADGYWHLVNGTCDIFMKAVPAIVILFFCSVPLHNMKQEQMIRDCYSCSRLFVSCFIFMIFIGIYNIASFWMKSFIGTGTPIANYALMESLFQIRVFQLHEMMFKMFIPMMMLFGYLYMSELKLIQFLNQKED